jgi:CBS domain containing-hemolysin-like protein
MRPVRFVPEALPAEEVLALMQREHLHLVIVLDEYGGTAGMITIEDLFEEIVGEFEDEFDLGAPAMELKADGRLWVRGDVPVDDLADLLDVSFESEEADTVSGLVIERLGRLPKVSEEVDVNGMRLRVEEMERTRIGRVSLALNEMQRLRWQERYG